MDEKKYKDIEIRYITNNKYIPLNMIINMLKRHN